MTASSATYTTVSFMEMKGTALPKRLLLITEEVWKIFTENINKDKGVNRIHYSADMPLAMNTAA